MQELEITWQRAARIWWLIIWRFALGAVIFGAIIGGIVGAVEGAIGLSTETIEFSAELSAVVVIIVLSPLVVHMALRKKYADFRLALIPHNSN